MSTDLNPNTNPLHIKKYRRIIKILLIILFGVLVGFLYSQIKPDTKVTTQKFTRPTPDMNKEPESPTAYAQVDSLKTMSTSDEIAAIEADLESTNLDSLFLETPAIEAELSAFSAP